MNTRIKSKKLTAIAALAAVVLVVAFAEAQTPASKPTGNSFSNRSEFRLDLFRVPARRQSLWLRPARFSLMPAPGAGTTAGAATSLAAGPYVQVLGSGTVGKLTKWTGITSGNSLIGDSSIFEDKFGKVGIGTDSPTSRLTVAGMIETTLGGFKFPDGTVQTTSAAGALFSVAHDATLQGNGTSGSPLRVAIPLLLLGSRPSDFLIAVSNNSEERGSGILALATGGGDGVAATGGFSSTGAGGIGVAAQGGNSSSIGGGEGLGGFGIRAFGGEASGAGSGGGGGASVFGGRGDDFGGDGLIAQGGEGSIKSGAGVTAMAGTGAIGVNGKGGLSFNDIGGAGVRGEGGLGVELDGGVGVRGEGGVGRRRGGDGVSGIGGDNTDIGNGGEGVTAVGGVGTGVVHRGGIGIRASGGSGMGGAVNGPAGFFEGDVVVTGNLTKGGGSFKIDHPLDPENKYLYHSFVESPDMKNIYDGVIRLDASGEAIVAMPEWFSALNRDFRYLVTPIGAPMPGLYIAEELHDNRFRVAGGQPGMKVSWQVTGIRRDAYATRNRIKVEEDKTEQERGFYLHPEAFDQPEERGIEWARNPETMQRMKQTRMKQLELRQQKSQSNDL